MRPLRKLALLTLAAVAVCACFGMSGASASEFEPGEYPAEVEGTIYSDEEYLEQVWRFEAGPLTCGAAAPFTGLIESAAVNETLQTSQADYECSTPYNKYLVETEETGCAYTFHPGSEVEAGKWQGKFDLADAVGRFCSGLQITQTTGGVECRYTIAPATERTGVTYEVKEGSPDTVIVTIDQWFPVELEGGKACFTGGVVLEGRFELSATEFGGESPLYLHIEGDSEWEGEESSPVFEAEQYSATISPSQGEGPFTIETGVPDVSCGSASFSTSTLEAASSSLGLAPSFSSCQASQGESTWPAAVAMHGCTYTVAVAGTMGVSCPAEKAIEVTIYEDAKKESVRCVYQVAGQAGQADVTISNSGIGTGQGIDLGLAVENIAITRTTGSLFKCGLKSQKAKFTGSARLTGSQGGKAVGVRVQ